MSSYPKGQNHDGSWHLLGSSCQILTVDQSFFHWIDTYFLQRKARVLDRNVARLKIQSRCFLMDKLSFKHWTRDWLSNFCQRSSSIFHLKRGKYFFFNLEQQNAKREALLLFNGNATKISSTYSRLLLSCQSLVNEHQLCISCHLRLCYKFFLVSLVARELPSSKWNGRKMDSFFFCHCSCISSTFLLHLDPLKDPQWVKNNVSFSW